MITCFEIEARYVTSRPLLWYRILDSAHWCFLEITIILAYPQWGNSLTNSDFDMQFLPIFAYCHFRNIVSLILLWSEGWHGFHQNKLNFVSIDTAQKYHLNILYNFTISRIANNSIYACAVIFLKKNRRMFTVYLLNLQFLCLCNSGPFLSYRGHKHGSRDNAYGMCLYNNWNS